MMRIAVAALLTGAAIAIVPVAQADPGQAGLSQPFSAAGGPFIGEWTAHGERVIVNHDGSGTETYTGGSRGFQLNFVQSVGQPTTAYGNVPGGGFATLQLVDGGNGMLFSVANGDSDFPFCKVVGGRPANDFDCGA